MNLPELIKENYFVFQIGVSFLGLILYFVTIRIFTKVVLKRALSSHFDQTRSSYVRRVLRSTIGLIFLVYLGIVWEISFEGLSVYLASILTIVGVGLFANWSIVSNITASVILFFFFPFKIGSKVRIIDGDNSIEGEVLGLSLFSIRIKRKDGHEVFCPNNLAIQKSVVHLEDH